MGQLFEMLDTTGAARNKFSSSSGLWDLGGGGGDGHIMRWISLEGRGCIRLGIVVGWKEDGKYETFRRFDL